MGEKNAGRGKPLHPMLAKLSPSALRASGLRTVARKVRKQNIQNYKHK